MPPLRDSLCLNAGSIYNGTDQAKFNADSLAIQLGRKNVSDVIYSNEYLELNLTMNGRDVKYIGERFLLGSYVCQAIAYEISDEIEEEIFELGSRINFVGKSLILRNLKHLQNEFTNTAASFTVEKLVRVSNILSINLLQYPFDTDCKRYEKSQFYCYIRCVSKNFVSISTLMAVKNKCGDKCNKSDCSKIRLVTFQRKWYAMQVIFGTRYISVNASPLFPFTLLIQQLIGLITIFFDVTILDLKIPLYRVLTAILKLKSVGNKKIKKKAERRRRRFKRKLIRAIVLGLIIVGCLFHVSWSTSDYMQYRSYSETYIGKSSTQYLPYMGVCNIFPSPNQSQTEHVVYNATHVGDELNTTITLYRHSRQHCVAYAPSRREIDIKDRELIFIASLSNDQSVEISSDYFDDKPKSIPQIISFRQQHVVYSSEVWSQKNLLYPYASRCIDYESLGMKSKEVCYDRCIKNTRRIVNEFNTTYTANLSNPRPCFEQCKHVSCNEIAIVLAVESRSSSANATIGVLRHDGIFSVQLSPEQSGIDFLTYTASILSLWVGFSGASLLEWIATIEQTTKRAILKLSRNLIGIFLVITCIVHIYLVLSSYMQYEISSLVILGSEGVFTLPAISLIFRYDNQTSGKNITHTEDIEQLSPSTANDLFLNTDSLIESLTLLSSVNNSKLPLPKDTLTSIMEDYIYYDKKITTIALNRLKGDAYIYNSFKSKYVNFLFKVDFIRSLKTHYSKNPLSPSLRKIMLHSHSYESSTSNGIGPLSVMDQVGFKIYRALLLKHPYSSQCIDYSDPLEKKDTLYNCIYTNHVSLYRRIPNTLIVPAISNYSRMMPDKNIIDYCYKLYGGRRYCESTEYRPIIFGGNKYRDRAATVKPPYDQTLCKFSPKTSFLDLTILIADTLGLWLGISLIFLMNKLDSIYHGSTVGNASKKWKNEVWVSSISSTILQESLLHLYTPRTR